MKTSNKLLITLALLLFAVPLIIMMGFKSAIKSENYVTKSNTGYGVYKPKELKSFAAIKLNGLPEKNFGLKTFIRYGDKYSYFVRNYDEANIENGRTDRLRVRYVGDTLVVDYNLNSVTVMNAPNYSYGIEMDITIPHPVPVIANFANITIDSSAAALGSMNVELSAGSFDINPAETQREDMPQTVFRELTIKANNASINIGDRVNIKNLKVALNGRSDINFRETATIDTLSGHISDTSFFNAPYRYSKFLK